MSIWKKKPSPSKIKAAEKAEEVRQERGNLAAGIAQLGEARSRLEALMARMIDETHTGKGKA